MFVGVCSCWSVVQPSVGRRYSESWDGKSCYTWVELASATKEIKKLKAELCAVKQNEDHQLILNEHVICLKAINIGVLLAIIKSKSWCVICMWPSMEWQFRVSLLIARRRVLVESIPLSSFLLDGETLVVWRTVSFVIMLYVALHARFDYFVLFVIRDWTLWFVLPS